MTDQSRVEAVARAIDQSGCWETYDDLMRAGGYFPSDSLLDRLEKSKQRAQAAIESNDAWLKEQADAIAEKLHEIEIRGLNLRPSAGHWTHMREMKSEGWHIAMIKAKNAITAVTSLGATPEKPGQ